MADYPGIPSSARFAALTSNNIILNPIHALWRLATLVKWYKEYETLKQNPLYATENSTNVRLTPSAKKIRNNGDEEIEPTPNALKRKSSLLEMISSPSSGRTSKKKDPRSKLNFLRPNSTRIDSFSIDESVGSATFVSSSDKTTSMPIDSAKSAFDFLKKLRQCDAIKASDTEQGQEEIDQSLVARPVTPGRQARRQIQSRTSPSRHADLFSPVTRPGQALRIDCISTNSTLSLGFNERLQQALFSPSPKKSGKEAEVTESKLIVESENDKDLEGKLEEFHEEEEADDLKPPAFDDDEPIQLENEFDNSHQNQNDGKIRYRRRRPINGRRQTSMRKRTFKRRKRGKHATS